MLFKFIAIFILIIFSGCFLCACSAEQAKRVSLRQITIDESCENILGKDFKANDFHVENFQGVKEDKDMLTAYYLRYESKEENVFKFISTIP